MKKIATTLVAFSIACAASAANFVWGNSSYAYTDQNGEELTSGTAFLYLGTVTASDSAFDTSSATLLASGGFDTTFWSFGNVDADNLSSNDALVSTTAGQAYTLIIVNADVSTLDGFEGYYDLMTGSSAENTIPGATVTKYADFVSYDSVATTSLMQAQSVPEPTSGLLLLLGMAGLALKRKRA